MTDTFNEGAVTGYAAPPSADSFVHWLACRGGSAFLGEYVSVSGGDLEAATDVVTEAVRNNLVDADFSLQPTLMGLTADGYDHWGALSRGLKPAVDSTLAHLFHCGGVKPVWLCEQQSGGSDIWQKAIHELIRDGYACVIVHDGRDAVALTPSGNKMARSIVDRAHRDPSREVT